MFANLGETPKGTDCPAIDGISKEADETAGEIADKSVLDAAIIPFAINLESERRQSMGLLPILAGETP